MKSKLTKQFSQERLISQKKGMLLQDTSKIFVISV
jgi:hypothetical protein